MAYGSINVDTITGSGASSVIVNNGTNNVAGFTTGNNIQLLQNGGGIVFSNSSATTNSTLNDYETGTWTPSITAGITGITYGNQTGNYTKIGNLVYCACQIRITAGTTNSSNFTIGGFPFTESNASGANAGSGAINYQTLISSGTGGITLNIGNGTTSVTFNSFAGVTYLGTNCATNGYLYFMMVYQATF
jgi:hypothetical protein